MKNEIAELVAGTRANCAREQLLKIYSKKKKKREREREREKIKEKKEMEKEKEEYDDGC